MRFLVVEDNCLLAWSLEWTMIHRGHEVVGPVGDADKAETLLNETFDGAVLDVGLLDSKNASVVAQRLQATGVPFVVHSGQTPDVISACCGSALRISKPAQPQRVVEALEALVMRHAGH